MNNFTLLSALCLPELDIEALGQGRMISAILYAFLRPGQSFLLYPSSLLFSSLELKEQYKESFLLSILNGTQHDLEPIHKNKAAQFWARCEFCTSLQKSNDLNEVSALTVWTPESLREVIRERGQAFWTVLRVYQLREQVQLLDGDVTAKRLCKPIVLPESVIVDDSLPVLSERLFTARSRQVETIQPPSHQELEKLEASLAFHLSNNSSAQIIRHEIFSTLGWRSTQPLKLDWKQPVWIDNISLLGNRSREEDQGKSNYQAGTDFEIAVRNSLEYLGFKIDYAHRGGAGGLDLSCSRPYTLVGECKSGKKIPNDTAVQLLNLGTLRLPDKETYRNAVKIIIGPGEPTDQLEKAAMVHGMSIINPTTLENLVKLHHQYPGSVDLFQLKEYLADGRADDEVDKYISKVREQIALRAHIIGQVKHYLEDAKTEDANVDSLHAVYVVSKPKHALSRQEFYEILVELASPLAGYLGRRKDKDGSDRFYFLRDLLVNR
jgi:hypothetical protein